MLPSRSDVIEANRPPPCRAVPRRDGAAAGGRGQNYLWWARWLAASARGLGAPGPVYRRPVVAVEPRAPVGTSAIRLPSRQVSIAGDVCTCDRCVTLRINTR